MIKKVLTVGAFGRTGKLIVQQLVSKGYDTYGLVRKQEQATALEAMGVHAILGDVEQDLSFAVKDKDAVIYAAGSSEDSTTDMTVRIDKIAAIQLIDLCKRQHIKHFIMISAYGVETPEIAYKNPEYWDPIETGLIYYESKGAADKHLQQSGLPYTILRPGALGGEEISERVEVATHFDYDYVNNKIISRGDVAQVAVLALGLDHLKHKTIELAPGGQKSTEDALKEFK